MKRDTLKKVDKAVDAASLLLLNEVAAARDNCPQLLLDVDPDGFKLEAFVIGFFSAMCRASNLPRESSTVRLVSYWLFLNDTSREDPLVSVERALASDLHPEYSPYFDHGTQSAARILAGDYEAGLYIEALREDSTAR